MHKGRNSKIKSKNEQIKRQRYTKRELRKTNSLGRDVRGIKKNPFRVVEHPPHTFTHAV